MDDWLIDDFEQIQKELENAQKEEDKDHEMRPQR